jgi:hypothetical protein
MNVNVSIVGVATSASTRALELVRDAIAVREQQRNGAPLSSIAPQPSRGQ